MANAEATLKALNAERQFADAVGEKLRKARTAESIAGERYIVLAGQTERPEGTGLIVSADELAKARRDREDAREEVGRLEAVLRASEGRIAEAVRVHEGALERDAFAESKRLAVQIAELEAKAVEAARAASSAMAARLKLRRRLVEISPQFARLYPQSHLNAAEAEGHDRALALLQRLVSRFYGPQIGEDKHTADIAEMRGIERTFVEALASEDGQASNAKAA